MENNQNVGKNKLFEEHPYFATKFEAQFSNEDLEKIGVTMPGLTGLPDGYIKLYPEDFIVEEVMSDKRICSIAQEPSWEATLGEKARFIHATLVKKGLPTLEATMRVARSLGVTQQKISHAGLKDAVAITSQHISIDGVDLEKIQQLKLEYIFLKDLEYKNYFNKIGNLYGNRFTLMIRTNGAIDEPDFQTRVDGFIKEGIPNFYSTQRFGRRLGSHTIGKKVLQGDFEGAVKELLSKTSSYEIPYVSMIRVQVQDNWRDWIFIESLYKKLPMYFINELQFIRCLKERPNDFVHPWERNFNLTKLYCYSYMSFVYNKTLSRLIASGNEVPKLFSYQAGTPHTLDVYLQVLKEEGYDLTKMHVRELPLLRLPKGVTPLIIYPEQVLSKIMNEGVILGFVLPKGAYATNFLSFLFNLREGEPRPAWVNDTQFDTKELLGSRPNILTESKNEPVSEEES